MNNETRRLTDRITSLRLALTKLADDPKHVGIPSVWLIAKDALRADEKAVQNAK